MVVFYYILWTLSLALKLSILRWTQMLFYGPSPMSWSEMGQVILTGFRFDLMVVGFWLAPIVIYLIISLVTTGRGFVKPTLARVYLLLSWLFICLLYFKDLVSYPSTRERLWLDDHLKFPALNWNYVTSLNWWSWVMIILLSLGLFQIGLMRFPKMVERLQKISLFSVAFIFLWTVLISRGTLSQHHLRRKDCQFSKNSRIESLCLNPVFTFSKKKN